MSTTSKQDVFYATINDFVVRLRDANLARQEASAEIRRAFEAERTAMIERHRQEEADLQARVDAVVEPIERPFKEQIEAIGAEYDAWKAQGEGR